ncbi:probable serine/threonine-protein kinase kinX [Halyomorpha halys]|uniref:probable serine/threonine-protein kinase kinX n=1 Tax=Halyomorpha halys TaxID=286706 RepID=UPI0034D2CD24
MGSIAQKLIIAATITAAVGNCVPPSTQPCDITSINNLRDKNIETIIVRVLEKIKNSNGGKFPGGFPHEDYLKLLTAHRAISEDLGSYELSAEQTQVNEFRNSDDGEFGKKLTESEQNVGNENEALSRSSDYGKYYYIRPNEPANIDEIDPGKSEPEKTEPEQTEPEKTESEQTEPEKTEPEKVEPEKTEPEKSEQEKNEQDKTDDALSNVAVESITKPDGIQSETTPPTDVSEEAKESKTEEPTGTVQPTTTVQPETQTYPSAEEQQENDFEGYRYEPVQNIPDSEKSDSTVIMQFPSSANENYLTREGRKSESTNYYQVETPQRTETGEESVLLQKSEEDQPDTNVLSSQSSDEEGTKPFSEQYNFVPSVVESKLVPTKPTPGSDIVVMGPTPIDIPDAQYQDENTTPLLLSFRRNISKAVETEKEENKNKYENVRHTVEFAASPLVAAFTVQQDDKGIPRNIIPLDYAHSTPPPAPTEDPEIVAQRQRELEEKEFLLYQQLKTLQQEKSRYISPQQQRQIMLQKKLEEMKRQQHFSNLNYYYHHSFQRRPESVQKEQPRQQVFQGPSEYLRYQELQRQRPHQNRNYFQPSQGFEFHKSVDYSVPQYEHNRVHRREPSNQIGNFGYNNYPTTVSGQIQSLINSSGIGFGLPRNTQADLGVVSKILALNHGGFEPSSNVPYRRNQNLIQFRR